MSKRGPYKVSRRRTLVRMFEAQDGRCAYCFNRMTLKLNRPMTATRDHVIPRYSGGPTEAWNMVAVCSTCNTKKSSKPLPDFLDEITDGLPHTHPMFKHPVMRDYDGLR